MSYAPPKPMTPGKAITRLLLVVFVVGFFAGSMGTAYFLTIPQ